MEKKLGCPPIDVLQELFEGKLVDPTLSDLSSHVEECVSCQEIARTLPPHDTLVEVIRADSGKTNEIVNDIPPMLVEKLKSIPQMQADDADQTAGVSASQLMPPDTSAELDFLSPPQQSDEIGRLGAYRILKVLGKGGMGMVFLADDPELDRKVALKVMLPNIAANPSAKQRFLREARAAAKLRNDHIVTIFQVSEDHGVPFLAMELLDGMPLDALLQSGPQLTLPQILRIGREIAQGLAVAHEKGLVHRDIKPANLWLDRAHGDRVKILDFGLARTENDDVHITQSGAIVGTPAYMAPEQGRGDKNLDARADLFSLGCVLYHLCTGDIPFKGETTMGVLTSLAVHVPNAPHEISNAIPRPLSELIMQLLEKDPSRRPQSAKEVIGKLTEIERSMSMPDAPSTTLRPSLHHGTNSTVSIPSITKPAARSRSPWTVGIAAGFVAAILALLGGILYIVTDNGTIEVKTDDKNVKVIVEEAGGRVTVLDPLSKQTFVINTGKYTIKLGEGADALEIDMPKERTFEMKRGGNVVVSVRKIERAVAAGKKEEKEYALDFDGNSSLVDLPQMQWKLAGPFTAELWVWLRDLKASQQQILVNNPSSVGLRFRQTTGGKERYWAFGYQAGGGFVEAVSKSPVQAGRWVHIAGVHDGSSIRLFIDGNAQGEPIPSKKAAGTAVASQILGANFSPTDRNLRSLFLDGRLREVRISTKARYDKDFTPEKRFESDKDTLALYHFDEGQGETLTDSSGNGHHGKIVGGAKWVKADGTPIASPLAQGLRFVAASSVQVPTLSLENRNVVTMEAYVTPSQKDRFQKVLGFGKVLSLDVVGGPDIKGLRSGWYFSAPSSNVAFMLRLGPAPVVANRRVHLAGVYDGMSLHFFVDGKLIESKKRNLAKAVAEGEASFFIGNGFEGVIEEVRVSKTVRYTKDFTPQKRFAPDGDTLALYHCDVGTSDVLTDSTGNGHHGKIVGAKWVSAARPIDEAWIKAVAAMPADQQVKQVTDKLKELNPGFDGKVTHKSDGDVVTELNFPMFGGPTAFTSTVTDITPLRALTGLRKLAIHGVYGNGKLTDLSPLKDLKLTHLDIAGHRKMANLSALKDMPLTELRCQTTQATDLAPLKGMKLTVLVCGDKKLSDLSALQGMSLQKLDISATIVSDLAPLRDMPLVELDCRSTDVSDTAIDHLRTLTKLVKLDLRSTKVTSQAIEALRKALPNCTILSTPDGALRFSGDRKEKVEFPSMKIGLDKPFTMEAYFTSGTPPANVGTQGMGFFGSGLGFNSTGKDWAFTMLGPARTSTNGVKGGKLVPNQKTHVAGVFDGQRIRLFVDGVQVGETEVKGKLPNPAMPPQPFLLGDTNCPTLIDEIRISGVARYTKNFTPEKRFTPDKDTIALYHCDEGEGTKLIDSSENLHHGAITGATWVKADPMSP